MSIDKYHNYDSKTFKKEAGIKLGDMNNEFITEEMILTPLYKKIKIDKNTRGYNFFPYNDIRVECYCKECNKRRIFAFQDSEMATNSVVAGLSLSSNASYFKLEGLLKNIDFFSFCAMADCKHKMIIHFMKIDEDTIMKIGQIPSIYDLNESINNKGFLKYLGEEYSKYYKSACSLYSFSTYIGALIYLRRIFEKLLIDTFNDNIDSLSINFDEFQRKRMEDKIKTLKPYLPTIMFNPGFNNIYTKISDGIHNLNEEECSKMFLILKLGIEEILIEKMENSKKLKRINELSKELEKI